MGAPLAQAFRSVGPEFPYDDRKRLHLRVDDDGNVVLGLDSKTITLTEAEAKRFSTALWRDANHVQAVIAANKRRRPMPAKG